MYRIFCESYANFKNEYKSKYLADEYRSIIAQPFELLGDLKKYEQEKQQESLLFKQLNDLLVYMDQNTLRYPKLKAFLWTLESRGIKGRSFYGVTAEKDLEEQTKLVTMFLNLLYWN